MFFKKFDISDFENKIFFVKNRKQNRIFEITITFVANKSLFLKFSVFSNDFFHLETIKIKDQILNNKNSDFKFLIINNENIMTKNFEFEYET